MKSVENFLHGIKTSLQSALSDICQIIAHQYFKCQSQLCHPTDSVCCVSEHSAMGLRNAKK